MKERKVNSREIYLRDMMYAAQRRLQIRTQRDMAEQLGMTEGTYKERLQNPGGLRMFEVWALESVCRHAGMEFDPAKVLKGARA